MKIDAAIRSGRPFRRDGMDKSGDWIDCSYDPKTGLFSNLHQLGLTADDVLAEDWEIKTPEPIFRLDYSTGIKVLLIDSRPVKALVAELSSSAIKVKLKSLDTVEALLMESP